MLSSLKDLAGHCILSPQELSKGPSLSPHPHSHVSSFIGLIAANCPFISPLDQLQQLESALSLLVAATFLLAKFMAQRRERHFLQGKACFDTYSGSLQNCFWQPARTSSAVVQSAAVLLRMKEERQAGERQLF